MAEDKAWQSVKQKIKARWKVRPPCQEKDKGTVNCKAKNKGWQKARHDEMQGTADGKK